MQVSNISDLRKAFRHGPYVWPEGYDLLFQEITGSLICFDCAKKHLRNILESLAHTNIYDGWHISEAVASCDFDDEYCEVCDKHFGMAVEVSE